MRTGVQDRIDHAMRPCDATGRRTVRATGRTSHGGGGPEIAIVTEVLDRPSDESSVEPSADAAILRALRERRIVLAHDWLVSLRGGELVLDRLARLVGAEVIHTLVTNGRPLSPALDRCDVRTSILQRVPGASGRLRRWMLPLMPMAIARLRVEPCDLLLSTSSCLIKGLAPPPGVPHVCYCHSPARYLWSQQEHYRRGLMGLGLRVMGGPLRSWDRRSAGHVTHFVAASSYIAERIEACFDRPAEVIHPPVRTDFFTPDPSIVREDFWLIAAALEPFKRIDLAIEAANRARHRLVVAGSGSLEPGLRAMAGPTVEFVGQLDAAALRDLARRARAFLFPSLEDFGIAPIEAMACGCPVAALGAGGALDTVDETCGAFMEDQTVEALLGAIERLPADDAACRRRAERFAEHHFDRRMAACLLRFVPGDGTGPAPATAGAAAGR